MSPPERHASERPTARDERVGTILGERYRIDALLGEGGMGKVYAAEHVLMRKKLAVKILHRELTQVPEVVARFEREAMAAANIEHPNVAAATDFGKLADGAVYLVLEFVQGRNLRDEIAKGPMPIERALSIARQIGSALAAAHNLEIVHRDLKPENVMLVEKGNDPDFVKVLDFGIARVPMGDKDSHEKKGKPITKAGMVFGTPEYMSPEQALGQIVDGRADVYAMGVILFEMIAGVRPFSSKSPVGILGQQLSKPPPSASERCPGLFVPPAVEHLLQKLLARDTSERFQTASDAVTSIEGVLGPTRSTGERLFTMAAGSPPSSPMNPRIASIPDLDQPVPVLMPPSAVAPISAGQGTLPQFPPPPKPLPPPPRMPSAPQVSVRQSAASLPTSTQDLLEADLDDEPPASIPGVKPLLPPHEAERFKAAFAEIKTKVNQGLGPTYEWIGQRRTRLSPKVQDRLSRFSNPALLAIGLALIFGTVLTLVVVIGALVGKKGKAPEPSASGSVSAPAISGSAPSAPVFEPAPDSDFEAAKKGGIAELETLKGRYPRDPRILLELAKQEIADKKRLDAVGTIESLLTLDPKQNENPEVASALWTTAQSRESSDETFKLLEGPMGAKGANMVFDLTTTEGIRKDLKQRAEKWLESDAFQKNASPALNVLVALKKATTCSQRKALLKTAKDDADDRALPLLQAMKKKSGCGKRGTDDCNTCLRGDSTLDDTIKEVEGRTKK